MSPENYEQATRESPVLKTARALNCYYLKELESLTENLGVLEFLLPTEEPLTDEELMAVDEVLIKYQKQIMCTTFQFNCLVQAVNVDRKIK